MGSAVALVACEVRWPLANSSLGGEGGGEGGGDGGTGQYEVSSYQFGVLRYAWLSALTVRPFEEPCLISHLPALVAFVRPPHAASAAMQTVLAAAMLPWSVQPSPSASPATQPGRKWPGTSPQHVQYEPPLGYAISALAEAAGELVLICQPVPPPVLIRPPHASPAAMQAVLAAAMLPWTVQPLPT